MMIRRKFMFIVGLVLFFFSLFMMFRQLDTQQRQDILQRNSNEDFQRLNSKLSVLENEIVENQHTMDKLRSGLEDIAELSKVANAKQPDRDAVIKQIINKDGAALSQRFPQSEFNFSSVDHETCHSLPHQNAVCDVDMTHVYQDMGFEDKDGGVWKQGFSITTSDDEWKGRTLKIFLVPHSHNDPGWIKTYESYFNEQTKHILDNVVDYLSRDSKSRFIWAEMSYLSMWYNIADPSRKEKLKNLLKNGQLEIVTGGWVMNDEANTHYFAMIDQLIEGHEWASKTLGVIPKSGWAIDPFGHTPTMAYLLKRMGFSNMLIQRVHYAVKKRFAEQKTLEFRWRQAWDRQSTTDIVCHMMPFYSYDVPHTCGPDPKICCQFDFGRLPGMRRSCPWGIPPRQITKENVAEKARIILDQYRKKSKLFKTNTVLAILGDDFRYDKMPEIEAQFQNYGKLFDYINSHPELNAKAQFGTLSDYFDAMLKEIGGSSKLPSLTGDFFTYADRGDHYWSGYYVSRPFYKSQERILESHLRGAEILFSLALSVARKTGIDGDLSRSFYPKLKEARQYLGLFQHHDGITGTSKDFVVNDYGEKLKKSIMHSKEIIRRSSELLLLKEPSHFKSQTAEPALNFDSIIMNQGQLPEQSVIIVDKMNSAPTSLVIYNSLSYDRTGLVSVIVTTSEVQVFNHKDQKIPSQVNQIWTGASETRLDQYELVFLASVAATGLATYKISFSPEKTNQYSKTTLINLDEFAKLPSSEHFTVTRMPDTSQDFKIENDQLITYFSPKNGLLKYIETKRDNVKTKVDVDFGVYEARGGKERAGAYLFLPNGHAEPHVSDSDRPLVRIVEGPLLKRVQVLLRNVEHTVSLHVTNNVGVSPLGVYVTNRVDIRQGFDNKEMSMRVTAPDVADLDNVFYTDLNGFQIQKHKTQLKKIPLQANFYPMPTMAFIQNDKTRLSILTAQPRGVASLEPGQIEIVLDRRLMQDDNRGLGQAVKDNRVTCDQFVILIERWTASPEIKAENHFPSIASHHSLLEILHPMWSMNFMSLDPTHISNSYRARFDPLPGSNDRSGTPALPCSFHVVNLRTIEGHGGLASDESALVLQNFGTECDMDTAKFYKRRCFANSGSSLDLSTLYLTSKVTGTSLSLQYDDKELDPHSEITVEPMEIKSLKITL